ncbi:MAG: DNA-binding protein WhiA [Lactobacillaceae bacterium]|jgi:DNA-binding protein WhiA|nr:DNA-binding protein WhiA [Lactobacillaceae bacterium]
MSFSTKVKKEISISQISKNNQVVLSELSAILRLNGIYHFGGKKNTLEIQTRNPASAQRVYKLINQSFNNAELQTNIETFAGKKTHRYGVVISKGSDELLDVLNLDPFSSTKIIPLKFYDTAEKQIAILKGAFLAGGSINDPKTKNYHLEIFSNNDYLMRQLEQIFQDRFPFKTINRRGGSVIYLKKNSYILDFLEVVGAFDSRKEYDNKIVVNEMRNQANRATNADSINLQRSLNASNEQIKMIQFIQNKVGLDVFDEKIRQIAELRLLHPEASLTELGEFSIENISKSGVRHRMKKIEDLYKQLN